MKTLLAIGLLFSLCGLSVSDDLYQNINAWHNYSEYCDECAQSPVHLITSHSSLIELPANVFHHYDDEIVVELKNTGDTVMLLPNQYANVTITAGYDKLSMYKLDHISFHWGDTGRQGSEHKIDFEKTELEMQLLHRNLEYSTIDDAYFADDGFLILAVLFRQASDGEQIPAGITAVCERLDAIRISGTSTTVDYIKMHSLFGELNMEKYFLYCGSLTVPPCTPNAVWMVFMDTMPISKDCLKTFYTLMDKLGRRIIKNFRPLQQPMNRQIFHRNTEEEPVFTVSPDE